MELIVFIFGLILGSFASSVLYRMEDLRTIVYHRSHCVRCKKVLKWYDLIPLLSFVLLGGRCRSCKEKISWEYPFLELVIGILFVSIYIVFGLTFISVCLMLVSLGLVIIFDYDIKKQIIPDIVLVPILVVWLIYFIVGLVLGNDFVTRSMILNSISGFIVGGLFLLLLVWITKGKGMGMGDVKLVAFMGLVLGLENVVVAMFFAFILGAIYSLYLLITKKKKMKSRVAFGPFLVIGFFISLFFAQQIINWYLI